MRTTIGLGLLGMGLLLAACSSSTTRAGSSGAGGTGGTTGGTGGQVDGGTGGIPPAGGTGGLPPAGGTGGIEPPPPLGGGGGIEPIGGTGGEPVGGTGGGPTGTTPEECWIEPDFDTCDACCMNLFPEGTDAWFIHMDECMCGQCADQCADACPVGSGGDVTPECASCSLDCIQRQCGATQPCAEYLACYGPCDYDGSGVTLYAAAEAAATADCMQLAACSPTILDFTFGDEGTCIATGIENWLWRMLLPDSGWNPTTLMACAAAIEGQACDGVLLTRTGMPAECAVPGTRLMDEACVINEQCESGFCNTPDYSCGICAAPPVAGTGCVADYECDVRQGQICGPNDTCMVPRAPGEVCNVGECDLDGECDPTGVCVELGASVGYPCGSAQSLPGCDMMAGLFCDDITAAGTCQPVRLVGLGESCGLLADGFTMCRGYSECGVLGTCEPPRAEGDPCDASLYQFCPMSMHCMNGVCTGPPVPYTCG